MEKRFKMVVLKELIGYNFGKNRKNFFHEYSSGGIEHMGHFVKFGSIHAYTTIAF